MKGQQKGSGKLKQVVLMLMLEEKNRFYALRSRGEQESSPNVVTCMLQVSLLMFMFYLIRVLYYPLLIP